MGNEKRSDLQCLRGIAIAQVLLFHFFPEYFKNGYIGVDLFFVLSGFLISMILHKNEYPLKKVLQNFYYSRIKRILPAYALFVFSTLVSLYVVFPRTNIAINLKSALPALFFYANQKFFKLSLLFSFRLAVGDNLFTHTWSLAVEIQFYLLVPFIYLFGRYIGINKSDILISFLSLCSLAVYFLAVENTSFNSVFARLWQFLAGYFVYLKTHVNDFCEAKLKPELEEVLLSFSSEKNQIESTKSFMILSKFVLLCIVLAGSVWKFQFEKTFLRISTTLLCSIWISLNQKFDSWLKYLRPIILLGDISYVLYLVHYPIYVFLKVHEKTTIRWNILGITISMIFSIAFHEYFEKGYLRWNKKTISSFIAFFYAGSILLIVLDKNIQLSIHGKEMNIDDVLKNPHNYSLEEIVKVNDQFSFTDRERLKLQICMYENDEGPFGVCEVQMNSSISISAMVIGNSYAPNMFGVLVESCKSNFRNVIMKSYPACEALWKTERYRFDCSSVIQEHVEKLKEKQPDYLFILSRHISLIPSDNTNERLEDERIRIVSQTLLKYMTYVKSKIFVLDSFPRPKNNIGDFVNKHILKFQMTSFFEAHKVILEMESSKWQAAHRILKKSVGICSKCQLVNLMPFLSNEKDEFEFVDSKNGLLHFVNNKHLSPYALQKIKPLFDEICEKL